MSSLYDTAVLEQNAGNFKLAEQLYQKAAAEASALSNLETQCLCFERLALLAKDRDDLHDAWRWYKKLYTFVRTEDMRRSAHLCMEIAQLLYFRGELDESYAWCSKTLELAKSHWLRELIAEAQLLLGLLALKNTDVETAGILFRRSRDMFEELKDQDGIYKTTFHLGLVQHQKGDFLGARKIFSRCLEQVPKEDLSLSADLYLRLAIISTDIKAPIDGLRYALASLGRYRKLKSQRQSKVWQVLFDLQQQMDAQEFSQQLAHHLNEDGLKKFHQMMALEREKQTKEPSEEIVVVAEEASESVSVQDEKTEREPYANYNVSEQVHASDQHLPDSEAAHLEASPSLSVEDVEITEKNELQEPTVISMEISTFDESEEVSEIEDGWQEVKRTPPSTPKLSTILLTGLCVFLLVLVTLYLVQAIF
ncbi:MAG: hypothetical protein VX278_17415 [Myxococcota bacterium]|nr:hypothetical protein [Myxococcota bacterium]